MEQTKKQRFFEIIRFLLVGGLSTILDYATTYGLGILLIGFWFNAAVSNTVGHIVGLLVNFFLSVVFVYKQVKNKATFGALSASGIKTELKTKHGLGHAVVVV